MRVIYDQMSGKMATQRGQNRPKRNSYYELLIITECPATILTTIYTASYMS